MALLRAARWFVLLLGLVLASLYLSWQALATINFGYPAWYRLLNIEQTIETYGPQNQTRPNFERTDQAERERLFAAMVTAIHRHGEGLQELVYYDATGNPIGPFLTRAEIIHLQDVADLIDLFRHAAWLGSALFVLLCSHLLWRRQALPSARHIALSSLGLIVIVAGGVLLTGPVQVFYALHELVFPAGHEWFFYYQDSLMSMMMQAPNLFGPIAVLWFVLAFVIAATLWFALDRLLKPRGVFRHQE